MSLAEVQNLLARLYTDADLREKFLADPNRTGRENNLSAVEIEQIAAVLPGEIQAFADSLFHKRRQGAEKFLPLTRRVLGAEFPAHFRAFANQFQPDAIKRHLQDAVEFTAFVNRENLISGWQADAVSFERARLEASGHARRFVFRRFDYDVREILSALSRDGGEPAENFHFKKRRTVAVWLRLKKTRHFIF